MNSYYKIKQIIAKVDEKGKVIGKIEKWEAHKQGVLHKALTVAILYKGQFVVQHRRHPAFDGVYDVTSSSHQLFINGKLQVTEEATYECLKREWNLDKKDLKSEPKNMGTIYYKAKDPKSIYTEHEICEVMVAEVKELPHPNYDFAYGFFLLTKERLFNKNGMFYKQLAPWVKTMIEEGKL